MTHTRTSRFLSVQPGCIAAAAYLLAACTAHAAGPYPVTWVWPSNTTAAAVQAQYPWINLAPERVNIDISLDSRTTWQPLARGVPSAYGTNTWHYHLPDQVDYLGPATVRIGSMPMYRAHRAVAYVDVQISGIVFVDPPAAVTNGNDVTLSWVASGAGGYVQLGSRVVGTAMYQAQALYVSQDSASGSITNTAIWPVADQDPGQVEIVLQSMADPKCHRSHILEVIDE